MPEKPSESQTEKGKAAVAIVVCGILRDEIKAVVRQNGLEFPTFYLAPAPCIDYDSLQKQLANVLERASKAADRLLVVIGRCHPDIDEIMSRYRATRLPMNNCFEALLGPRLKSILKEGNTFFTTPSWLKHWRRAFKKSMHWDQVDVRQNFGVYQRILVIDAGVTTYSDEEVLEFFDYTQVPIEFLSIDLSNFAGLLLEELTKLANSA